MFHDGERSFSNDINKDFTIDKSFNLTPSQQSDLFSFMKIDDNWIWNTHGKVYIAFKNTNKAPALPNYEGQPTAPAIPTATVHKVTVAEIPTPEAPLAPKADVTKVDVEALPAPVAPASQEVEVHYYDIVTTPEVPAPVVEKAILLPKTGAEKAGDLFVLSALASVVSFGLLGSVFRKFKKQ